MEPSTSDDDVELVVKRSSDLNAKDLKLKLPSASTLADLKNKVNEEYSDHPDPSCITVETPFNPIGFESWIRLRCKGSARLITRKYFLGSTSYFDQCCHVAGDFCWTCVER